MKRVGMVLLLVVACSPVGCRKSATYTDKDGTTHTVTQSRKGSQVTIEGKEGKVQVSGEGGLALPDGFPKDVPIYPGSTIAVSAAVKDGMHVALKTADPSTKVAAFYKEKMKTEGWAIEAATNTEESSMLVGKKDKRTLAVMTGRDSDGASVNLTLQTEQ
jgi:hypothetical protein